MSIDDNSRYTTVRVYADDEVVIKRGVRRSGGDKPVFTMIGSPVKSGRRIPGFPLLREMLKFTKEQQWLFGLLIEGINPDTNVTSLAQLDKTQVVANKISKAYKGLNEIGLVKRIKKDTYLINPTALIPPTTYEDVQAHWDSI